MFSTNGYRIFEMTRANRISRARKAIAAYQAALDTGLSFAGDVVTEKDRIALAQFIEGQNEVIAEAMAMHFHPGEW
jgi:hypothetical protein